MKKFFVLAATALALLACVQPEELPVVDPEVNGDGAVAFSVYTSRAGATRAGTPGDVTNDNICTTHKGFGVFAYYTAGEKYDVKAKPNFMYNQQVKKDASDATKWVYEPVKYWPNEYGNAAQSDEVDYVTFFAYAPWTEIEPTTGEVVATGTAAEIEKAQKFNIISVNKNNATGDPIIKYVVDTDPATSVDLLWGVAAADAAANYSDINHAQNKVEVTPGKPFINLTKPANPKSDKLSFNLKHSLAKVKFTIDYIADEFTPNGTSEKIDSAATRIFVRSFSIDGWETKGALNLNNNVAGEPLWKDFDGVKDLAFDPITFNDGRKDGKEGDVNGAQTNEENQGLNPKITENHAQPADNKFTNDKNIGVAFYPQLLFGGDEGNNGGYFYVIPRNSNNQKVNVTIVYDVETIDPNLAGLLSDVATHGSTIENVISKQDILHGMDFQAGRQYLVKIHIGMTSVKVEAEVSDWIDTNESIVDLPDNQPMPYYTVAGMDRVFTTNPATVGVEVGYELLYDEESWNASALNGVYKKYYAMCDGSTLNMPYADRYNAQTGKTAIEYYGRTSGKTAAEMLEAGYIRCWAGAIKDAKNGFADLGSHWPVVAWDYTGWVVPDEIQIKDGENSFSNANDTRLDNKIKGTIGCTTLDEAFNGNVYMTAEGVITKPTDLKVIFKYAANKVTKHTLYEDIVAPTD